MREAWLAESKLAELRTHRCTKEAMFPNLWNKMRVGLAHQVLSTEFAESVRQHGDSRRQTLAHHGILQYMEQVMKMWDVLNDAPPLCSEDEDVMECLLSIVFWFEDWLSRCEHPGPGFGAGPAFLLPPQFIPYQCYYDLKLTALGLPLFLWTYFHGRLTEGLCLRVRRLNQDCVEQLFSELRSGSDHSLTAKSALEGVARARTGLALFTGSKRTNTHSFEQLSSVKRQRGDHGR